MCDCRTNSTHTHNLPGPLCIGQDQSDVLEGLEKELHDKQQADAVASSNYDESCKEIKSQNKKLKELKKHTSDVSVYMGLKLELLG